MRGKGIGNRKNGSERSKRKLNFVADGPQHNGSQCDRVKEANCNEVELNMDAVDAIGSNNHSLAQEDQNLNLSIEPSNDPGGSKRKIARKFVDRVQMTLNLHEAADPTPRERNEPNNTLHQTRTQYMHQNISNPQNNGNSNQASATSDKRKKGQRGKYKSLVIEKKTLGGNAKLVVDIPDYVLQVVGDNARNLVNYCGHIVRTKALMDASPWIQVAAKYGEAMWLLVKGELHQLVKDMDKEGAPQTQEEMLLHVLDSKSGYTRDKGSGYGGSIRARIQEEQQQKINQQQKKIEEQQEMINDKQNKISGLQSQIDEVKEKHDQSLAAIEKRMLEMSEMMAFNNTSSKKKSTLGSRNTLDDDGDVFHDDDDYY